VHNGHGHGNGKRWIFIVLLILGAFWLVNDSYQDGYTDALVQTGQAGNVRYYRGGPDFPWGLLILGGLGYVAWRKGAFDRFGGPGGPFGSGQGNGDGQRGVQRYGPGSGYAPGQQQQQQWGMFRGPRAVFDDWHREAHRQHAPQPPAPPMQTPGNGAEHGGFSYPAPPASAPAPTPPAPEYWATMTPPEAPPAPPQAQEPPGPEPGETPRGATGPVLERW
jgi:hypothetical protein